MTKRLRHPGRAGVRLFGAAMGLVLVVTAAAAQDTPAYRDDRSTATSVIESLYNAINRHEYLRAWSYFETEAGGDDATADYEAFKEGYADTVSVTIVTGTETAEGAAGSTYYTIPAAIEAVDGEGKHRRFAGCYTLRLAQPAIQDTPPFSPLHIIEGALKPVKSGDLDAILPESCES